MITIARTGCAAPAFNRRLGSIAAIESVACFGSWGKSFKVKKRKRDRKKLQKRKITVEEAIEKLKPKIYFDEGQYCTRINLNLDSTMSGQVLYGYFDLPHGSGQTFNVVALTADEELAKQAAAVGAKYVGGADLADRMYRKKVAPTKHFERAVVCTDLETVCTGRDAPVGRMLFRNKMTPRIQDHTLVEPQDFVEAVRKHVQGYYFGFRTRHPGKLFTVLGRTDGHSPRQVRENLEYVLEHLLSIRPHDFGRGDRANPIFREQFILSITLFASMIGGTPIGMSRLAEVPLQVTKDGRILPEPEKEEEDILATLFPDGKTDAEKLAERKAHAEKWKKIELAFHDEMEDVQRESCERAEYITGRKMISMRDAIDRYYR